MTVLIVDRKVRPAWLNATINGRLVIIYPALVFFFFFLVWRVSPLCTQATVMCDIVVLYLLKKRNIYKECKYQNVNPVTDDGYEVSRILRVAPVLWELSSTVRYLLYNDVGLWGKQKPLVWPNTNVISSWYLRVDERSRGLFAMTVIPSSFTQP